MQSSPLISVKCFCDLKISVLIAIPTEAGSVSAWSLVWHALKRNHTHTHSLTHTHTHTHTQTLAYWFIHKKPHPRASLLDLEALETTLNHSNFREEK